jgi:hypothetical protein
MKEGNVVKRKFAVLSLVAGALFALAVPASSMARLFPPNAKFEIVGSKYGPKFETSLGSCVIGKISGQIPAPQNPPPQIYPPFGISAPTAGECSSGTSLTLGGEWKFSSGTASPVVSIFAVSPNAVTMRFSSLPGCKLTDTAEWAMLGIWSNGIYLGEKSAFTADSSTSLTWADDGASCALAGTREPVSIVAGLGKMGSSIGFQPWPSAVNNLTSPTTPIEVRN